MEIVQKENCINIQHLYEGAKAPIHTINDLLAPADMAYRKKVENALEEEFLFRVTVRRFKGKSEIGIQLMNLEDEEEEEKEEPPEITAEEEDDDLVQSPTPLFLKRNVFQIKTRDSQREKRFTTQAGSVSMTKSISVSQTICRQLN